jgi:hypothetical protein
MGDQYVFLQHDPHILPVQVGVHSVRPLARPEAPNLWFPCLPDSPWWQHLSHVSSQVHFNAYGHEQWLIATYSTPTGHAFHHFRWDKPSYILAAECKRDGQITHPLDPVAGSDSRKGKATSFNFSSRCF